MEKMGWQKGQGLGKDSKGMTTCLNMRKQDGSSSQGRIERAAPLEAFAKSDTTTMQAQAEAQTLLQSMGSELGLAVPEPKRMRVDPQMSALVPLQQVANTAMFMDIDPRDPMALLKAQQPAQAELKEDKADKDVIVDSANPRFGLHPKVQKTRVRQYVRDDWRWSKGTEALRYFEEVQLPKPLLGLAKKILGENSRYPARITDDTDCVAEVTAWGTLLVRPRGTGARMELAKRMLYEVLHPHSHELREDALLTPDEMAEAANKELDPSVIELEGDDEATKRMREGLARSHGQLRKVGVGAEDEAAADAAAGGEVKQQKSELTEVPLATTEDVALVQIYLDKLRSATGCTAAIINDATLKLYGKEKQTRKASQLIRTLIETGEWVALTEGFVPSAGEDFKARTAEGPSEQILLKVPELLATQKIEKHIKAMEKAAQAEQLKLTSKAVAGKRTLMVEGTKAVHERVKLMVKELSEKGESPMLNKVIAAWGGSQPPAEKPQTVAFSETFALKTATSGSNSSTPGVLSAPPKLNTPTPTEQKALAKKPPPTGVGMRMMPGPKLAASIAAGTDLYAGMVEIKDEDEVKTEVKMEEVKVEVKEEIKMEVKEESVVKEEPDDENLIVTSVHAAFPPQPPAVAFAASVNALLPPGVKDITPAEMAAVEEGGIIE